jgi:hypothetical protein
LECPQSLRNFLCAGDPPIYVGFGSMVGFDQRTLLDVVIAAVAGRRALFYPGCNSADLLKLPPNFCVIGRSNAGDAGASFGHRRDDAHRKRLGEGCRQSSRPAGPLK